MATSPTSFAWSCYCNKDTFQLLLENLDFASTKSSSYVPCSESSRLTKFTLLLVVWFPSDTWLRASKWPLNYFIFGAPKNPGAGRYVDCQDHLLLITVLPLSMISWVNNVVVSPDFLHRSITSSMFTMCQQWTDPGITPLVNTATYKGPYTTPLPLVSV